MKRWKEHIDQAGEKSHILLFEHHYEDEKMIVCLFRDNDGDWNTTSDLLNTFWEYLTDADVSEADAKEMVEEMVREHYEDEMKYYKSILEQFDND